MQWLYRVIGQAGIFLICAQTVVHFRPKESYDKYLKLLLSVMLLLQLLQPVLTMFGGGDGWNAEEQVTGFIQELQTVLTRASEQAEQSQEEIGNTAAAVQEAGEGYDPANDGSKILHRELLQEKIVGKYRIRRKQIGKMQKRRGSMWTLHQSGWNDGEVCRRVKENDGRKTGAGRKKDEKQWVNSGKRSQAALAEVTVRFRPSEMVPSGQPVDSGIVGCPIVYHCPAGEKKGRQRRHRDCRTVQCRNFQFSFADNRGTGDGGRYRNPGGGSGKHGRIYGLS